MDKLDLLWNFIHTRYIRIFKTRAQLLNYQDKQIVKHVAFLKEHSPYYKNHDILTTNFMDKAFMMDNFDELNTVKITKKEAFDLALKSENSRDFTSMIGDISVGLSSGTSGHRGVFLTSPKERNKWAGTILAKLLPKDQLLNHRLAFFMRANNQLYETIDSKVINLTFYDMFRPLNELIDELITQQPTMLIAPASILLDIATEFEHRSENISPVKVISVAEVLEERDAKYIAKVFNQKLIHQIYQCTEGFLGCTCEHGTLHLNEDILKVEPYWIDESRFHPIITDFNRQSQPIIRYLLNDILVIQTQPCPCGSPLLAIKKIEGRADDVFEFAGPGGNRIKVYPDFIRRCMLYVDDIMHYRVIQKTDSTLEIQYIGDQGHQDIVIMQFTKLAKQLGFILPSIRFTEYNRQLETKLKRVIKEVG